MLNSKVISRVLFLFAITTLLLFTTGCQIAPPPVIHSDPLEFTDNEWGMLYYIGYDGITNNLYSTNNGHRVDYTLYHRISDKTVFFKTYDNNTLSNTLTNIYTCMIDDRVSNMMIVAPYTNYILNLGTGLISTNLCAQYTYYYIDGNYLHVTNEIQYCTNVDNGNPTFFYNVGPGSSYKEQVFILF